MVCPKCKTEAIITNGQKMIFSKEENKLYRLLQYKCRNKKCDNYEKVIGEQRNEIPVTTE